MTVNEDVEVVIEIPQERHSPYGIGQAAHGLGPDRPAFSASSYPADYGFITGTLAADATPLDALVLAEEPSFPGCRVVARPVAVLQMDGKRGPDDKIICVGAGGRRWEAIKDLDDLPVGLTDAIYQFFCTYTTLAVNAYITVRGYAGHAAAMAQITASRERFDDQRRRSRRKESFR